MDGFVGECDGDERKIGRIVVVVEGVVDEFEVRVKRFRKFLFVLCV